MYRRIIFVIHKLEKISAQYTYTTFTNKRPKNVLPNSVYISHRTSNMSSPSILPALLLLVSLLSISVNGYQGLLSHHKKYVSAQPDGSIEANRDRLYIWERIDFVPLKVR